MADDGDDLLAEQTELDPLSLDDALAVVGEETRARIVMELGDAWGDSPEPPRLSFSELMERVGAEDSGRFNYHLDKLVGSFVTKNDDGYALRQPGLRLHQTFVSGTFTDREPLELTAVGDCTDCDGTLQATYRSDHIVAVRCDECGTPVDGLPLAPQGVASRDAAGAIDAAYQKFFHELAMRRHGVCPGCDGVVDRDLTDDVGEPYSEAWDRDVFATMICTACSDVVVGHPVRVAMTAPAVAAFYHEHGRDPALVDASDPAVDRAGHELSVVAEEPMRVALPFELGGERLRVVLDDDLQVADAERTDAEPA